MNSLQNCLTYFFQLILLIYVCVPGQALLLSSAPQLLSVSLCFYSLPNFPSHVLNKLYSTLYRCMAGTSEEGMRQYEPAKAPPPTSLYLALSKVSFFLK